MESLSSFDGCFLGAARAAPADDPARPAAIQVEGVPVVPAEVVTTLKRYQDVRNAQFVDWDARGGMLVATRPGNLYQLHRVGEAGARPEQLTSGDDPVTSGEYLPDGALLFSRARGGDENFQVYRLDPATGKETLLTDGKSRNLLQKTSPDGKLAAISSTRRNGRDADIYLLDLTGARSPELIFQVERETWSVDDWSPDGKLLLLSRTLSYNETYAVLFDVERRAARPLPAETAALGAEQRAQRVARDGYRFGPRGESVLFLSDARGEYRELARLDLASGRTTWPVEGLEGDVEAIEVSPDRTIAAIGVNAGGYSRLHLLEGLDGPMPRRREVDVGDGLIGSFKFSPDGRRLGLTLGKPAAPVEAYALALAAPKIERWTSSERAGFEATDFVAPRPFRYRSFDGREIPAFLFLPPAAARRGTGAKTAVLVVIHGGPESQYRPWFSAEAQHYARELGVAVIAPNVRGSSGYGKTYSLLDNGTRREDSVKDIGALLDWIAGPGAADFALDPARVAVSGGSYGGYMVLASLVGFGERIRAGVASVGISNFVSFLENTSAYRRDLRREEYGDERDPEMRRFFERISPARRLDQLRSALLLIHGVNDPRVPFSESVQAVARARSSGQPVWTLYAEGEGHGFTRRENIDYQQAAVAVFLRRFLLAADAGGK